MLNALPYHYTTTQYFQQQTAAWQFFSNQRYKQEQLKEFKIDLLKNTYKFDETTDASLYQKVALAKEKLGLPVTVTLYQAENTEEMNASIVYIDNEAHIVFTGKLVQFLSEDELLAVIAHELSHVQLYSQMNGQIEVSERIVSAIANHFGCTPAHYETARLFKLYTEIFCDRGAYTVTGSYAPIISSLVKISTGLSQVNADNYIRQAEEIFATDANTRTSAISHPENFIRARAIWLWHTKGAEAEPAIRQMIEGQTGLEEMDLFKQQQVAGITRQLISLILHPGWIQTPATIGLGQQFFADIDWRQPPVKSQLAVAIENLHPSFHDYLAYLLYDFCIVDKSLEDVPLGYCFALAGELKLDKAFTSAVKKEKKLSDKKTERVKKEAMDDYHKQESTA